MPDAIKSLADAQAHLSELVDRVEAGDSIEITRALTATMPPRAGSADDVVRSMQDGERY